MEKIIIGEKLANKKYDFRETCFGICMREGKLALVKKDKQFSFIGGGVEQGETHEDCLKREFLEEAGYEVLSFKPFVTIDCFWLAGGKWPLESLANFYIVELGKRVCEPTEEGHVVEEVPIEKVEQLLPLPYHKKALELFVKGNNTMKNEKRVRARAIIIKDGKIVSMYRERADRIFYTFPGGGQEGNETEEQCVVREVYEEFGINVKPIKKVYVYENQSSIEHFYVCDWVSGDFGTGEGEEYQREQTNGLYVPKMIDINNIPNIPLMPPEVASEFYKDYVNNGDMLRNDVKYIYGKIK